MIDVRVQLISDNVSPGTIHGWHSSRLLKYDGTLYAFPTRREDAADYDDAPVQIYSRKPGGQWEAGDLVPLPAYTTCFGPAGEFWTYGSYDFNNVHVWRSAPLNINQTERLHSGKCFYGGTGVDDQGNFLALHSERTEHYFGVPNKMMSAFYDVETDRWHHSQMPTPEGRYGYVGVIVRGRQAYALLKSTVYDFAASPMGPMHYNWRHIRLVKCDDLTKGVWTQHPWLVRRFGMTWIHDLSIGPDGHRYIFMRHRGGDESFAATEAMPIEGSVSRWHNDLSVEQFKIPIEIEAGRMHFSQSGRCYITGRPTEGRGLRLWELSMEDFSVAGEWDLPGTEAFTTYVYHTLKPERFGGEDDGDTVHLMTASVGDRQLEDGLADLWHVQFDLPK